MTQISDLLDEVKEIKDNIGTLRVTLNDTVKDVYQQLGAVRNLVDKIGPELVAIRRLLVQIESNTRAKK